MTAEPRPVPAEHPACEHHWTSIHQPDFPVAVYWIDTCSLCGDINGARLAEEVEPLLARLVAADRENAELRGEVERLAEWRGSQCEVLSRRVDEARAQLAAAQAQLAEARAESDRVGEWINHYKAEQEAIIARYMARLEAVRAACDAAASDPDESEWVLVADVRAALSAAPQPEPERDARVGDTVTATLRGTLIAYDTDLGKWTLETDGTDHIAWQIELHWAQPFEVVQREPESPASDDPGRCAQCGRALDPTGCCIGPPASVTPAPQPSTMIGRADGQQRRPARTPPSTSSAPSSTSPTSGTCTTPSSGCVNGSRRRRSGWGVRR